MTIDGGLLSDCTIAIDVTYNSTTLNGDVGVTIVSRATITQTVDITNFILITDINGNVSSDSSLGTICTHTTQNLHVSGIAECSSVAQGQRTATCCNPSGVVIISSTVYEGKILSNTCTRESKLCHTGQFDTSASSLTIVNAIPYAGVCNSYVWSLSLIVLEVGVGPSGIRSTISSSNFILTTDNDSTAA